MKKNCWIFLILLLITACSKPSFTDMYTPVETRLVGDPCVDCAAVMDFGDKVLKDVDTLPDYDNPGLKMAITGTVYLQDGITPAPGVILYIYHTNQQGLYATSLEGDGWERRHGEVRGWVQTNKEGYYTFYTLKPKPYPRHAAAPHIHVVVMEPDGSYYRIEDFTFKGDAHPSAATLYPIDPRGGEGALVTLVEQKNFWVGKRDIVLGKNIPNYE